MNIYVPVHGGSKYDSESVIFDVIFLLYGPAFR
jgi:hypothetical protein